MFTRPLMRTAKSSTYPGSFQLQLKAVTPAARVAGDHLPYHLPPDRDLDCEMAAEDAFQQLVRRDRRRRLGRRRAAAAAIEELARNHRLALDEVAATEAAILAVRRRS